MLRMIHHYVKPDNFKGNSQNFVLSDQHYWSFEGILSPGFHSKARFNYDGYKTVGGTYAYLDTLLTKITGDSIRIFYRKDATDDWKAVANTIRFTSNAKAGWIEIDTLKMGEYTFGSNDTAIVSSVKKKHHINKSQSLPKSFKKQF